MSKKGNLKIAIACFIFLSLNCTKSSGGGNKIIPSISINSITQFEGNGGTTPFVFTITLSAATTQQVSVNYSTVEGSAKAGEDFSAVANQTVIFQPGETTKTISITIVA